MVVLSAAICTKGGKALISRQFLETTRIRIEGLLAAFPKLMGTDLKQHTFVETESVRYVYQPMDQLYLLLITNRASNIVEDLETLRLLSKVVPNVVGTLTNLTEDQIIEKSFDLLFAFDEVITVGGYREPITLQQIRTNLDMDSHEEKLHNMIKISKMETAKDKAASAVEAIRQKNKEAQRMAGMGSSNLDSFSSNSASSSDYGGHIDTTSKLATSTPSATTTTSDSANSRPVAPSRQPVKGMSLGAAGAKNKSVEDALMREDKLAPLVSSAVSSNAASSRSSVDGSNSAVVAVAQQPITLAVVEKVSATLNRDGMVELFEIKGSLTLTAADDEAALCSVQLKPATARDKSIFSFNTHPKVNKVLYDQTGLLQLKETNKGFPSARPVGILKWSHSGTSSDELIPLKINCWPEEESRGLMNVSIEYSMDVTGLELHDVRITIPLGTQVSPTILSVDGNHKHNASTGELIWNIDLIDASNTSGSLEFSIQQRNADAFFPIAVQFASQKLYYSVDVMSVNGSSGAKTAAGSVGPPMVYGLTKNMSSEDYTIV